MRTARGRQAAFRRGVGIACRRCVPLFASLAVACGNGGGNGNGDEVLTLRPISLHIEGPQQLTLPGQAQFRAVQTWSDGSTVDVTTSAGWQAAKPHVLSISSGLATALAGGITEVRATFDGLASRPRIVGVMPSVAEWNGTYTLTVGGGACAAPLPPELRQRTYTAVLEQKGLRLVGTVPKVGGFEGQIYNPEVRFYLSMPFSELRSRPSVRRTTATNDARVSTPRYRRVYSFPLTPSLVEVLPDGNRLSINGWADTTLSPAGFAGGLLGTFRLTARDTPQVLGECFSPSHPFTLVRQ